MKRIVISTAAILLLFPLLGEATYKVQKGDTLFSIALRQQIPLEVLMEVNGLSDSSKLRIGQTLNIPGTYEVQAGDTYYRIAHLHKITVAELMDINGRGGDDFLLVGERLLVPREDPLEDTAPGQAEEGAQESSGEETPGEAPLASGKPHFWPHPGKRATLTGKLQGEAFTGKHGDKILSVSSGKVVWVAPYRGYNKLVIVEAPNEYVFAYGGNEMTFVSVGDRVVPGMEIGNLGVNPHRGTAQAFFFVYKDGKPVDPARAPRT